jgi:hypothetical protein
MSHEQDGVPEFLAELPRTAALTPGAQDRLVEQLRREGFFQRRSGALRFGAIAAAAAAIFAVGLYAGARYARQNSLEDMLARRDLTVAERVLLLQRAGSAYVHAAQSYADAAKHVDSTAVEVASRVLLGAAHAVARNNLDAGLSERLNTALTPVANRKPVIWF